MQIENDAVMVAPDAGLGMQEVARRLEARGRALEMQRGDPLRFGFEPDIWLVCRALLGMDRIPDVVRMGLADRTGLSHERCWQEWRDALCSNFGMQRFCSEMLINGANRSGKTDLGAKLTNEVAEQGDKLIWIGSADSDSSIDTSQKRVNHYLPSGKRGVTIKTKTDYVNYTDKNGFTDGSFCLHGSKVKFGTYSQDIKSQEGKEYDFIWPDEEVPSNWLDVLRFRAASRSGRIVCTFTPISGYTPVVADFQDGLRMVKTCVGYMLPRDGGIPLPWKALGLEHYKLLL
jgi:phage terminase large subunit-like protein